MAITDVCKASALILNEHDENANHLNGTKIHQEEKEKEAVAKSTESLPQAEFKSEIVWVKATFIAVIHALAIYTVFNAHRLMVQTIAFGFTIGLLGAVGVQVGAHRLWSHRSFKASFGLRVFLCACHTLAAQKTLYYWVRDHRVHHKYSETDADPHNSNRGFFFAHVGWIITKKHPEVLRKGERLDLSDLERDSVVMFQKRHYVPLVLLAWGVLPTFIPVYFWGESVWLAFLCCVIFRHVYVLNMTSLVNSYAHMFGHKPYDNRMAPVEASGIRHLMMGEGFHNFHHVFPWDYSCSELGPLDVFNPATAVIDFCHYMGWAWDLKKPSRAMVEKKMAAYGDPSFSYRNTTNSVCEWVGGVMVVFAPWLAIRWILMAINS